MVCSGALAFAEVEPLLAFVVLMRYDGTEWTSITREDGLPNVDPLALGVGLDGDVWIGNKDALYRYNGEIWTTYPHSHGGTGPYLNYLESLVIGPNGDVWVGAYLGGVSHYDGETWTWYNVENGLADSKVSDIAVGPDGVLWVGFSGGGISCYEPIPTFAETMDASPLEFAITGNYPNPFNPGTTIEYFLTNDATIKITIYNIIGQKVHTLISENAQAGCHLIRWDGKNEIGLNVPTGIYIANLETGSISTSHTMMILR